MAHLKRVTIRKATYFYIVQNRRRGDKVRQRVCEYLGRDPDPKRLKRALNYWGVKAKVGRRKRR